MDRARLPLMAVFVSLCCAHVSQEGVTAGSEGTGSAARCQMVEAALRVAVEERSGTGQGVDAECARGLASSQGKLQVDVVGSNSLAADLGGACVLDSFVIRPLASK